MSLEQWVLLLTIPMALESVIRLGKGCHFFFVWCRKKRKRS
jgi:hypothetical protein